MERQVSWMITVTLRVTMQQSRDEITYLIKKTEGLVKINSYLRFIILPTRDRTVVNLLLQGSLREGCQEADRGVL